MTNTSTSADPHISYLLSRPAMPALAQVAVRFAVLVTKWSLRHRTRKHLRHLTADQLNDVGISRQDAHYQGTLPFWRP